MTALGWLLACATVVAPEPVEGQRFADSPFQPGVLDAAPTAWVEEELGTGVVIVGVADMGEQIGLRVYVEQAPGEAWEGPLTVELANAEGTAELSLDRPLHPRSVPRPRLYEWRAVVDGPTVLRFRNGPANGLELELPAPADDPSRRHAWLPLGGVVVLWLVGFVRRR